MSSKINAKIVADSINKQGDRITSFILTYPRFIHGELMTHRLFSRNSASSRAIPFEKMIKSIEENPFIPIAWQIDHNGMQGKKYITDKKQIEALNQRWIGYSLDSCLNAKRLNNGLLSCTNEKGTGLRQDFEWKLVPETNVTKQLCNRLLEPFSWHTVLVTATSFDNFFNLRCPIYRCGNKTFKSWNDLINYHFHELKANRNVIEELEETSILDRLQQSESQAEIHIQMLAESMWDALNKSNPKLLEEGEWHLPFGDKIDDNEISNIAKMLSPEYFYDKDIYNFYAVQIATARCARLSYMTFNNEINYKKDIELHDKLLKDRHFSPFEHCARAMNDIEYKTHIKGISSHYDKALGEGKGLVGGFNFNRNSLGWSRNFKGFIQYRELID